MVHVDDTLIGSFIDPREDIRKIYRIYKIRPVAYNVSKEYETEEIGQWVKNYGFQVNESFRHKVVTTRKNFKKMDFYGGVVLFGVDKNKTVEYLKSHENRHASALNRRAYEAVLTTSEYYNFTINPFGESEWGWKKDGKWSGALGKVMREEADFSLCASRFEFERNEDFHYPMNLHYEIFSFNFIHPDNSHIRNVFLEPFDKTVWFCIALMVPFGAFFYRWNAIYERKYQKFLEKKLLYCFLIMWESILLQGPALTFRTNCMNIAIISMVLFGFMIFQFYGAFIVGSLLTWQPHTITSIPLLNASNLRFGMADVAYNKDLISYPAQAAETDIYKRMDKKLLQGEEGFKKVVEGGYAFGMAINDAYFYLKRLVPPEQFCDLEYIGIRPKFYTTTVMKKKTAFRDHIDVAYLWFLEIGVLNYLNDFWSEEKPKCVHESDFAPVGIQAVVPALSFLLFFFSVSLVVANLEKIYHFARKRFFY